MTSIIIVFVLLFVLRVYSHVHTNFPRDCTTQWWPRERNYLAHAGGTLGVVLLRSALARLGSARAPLDHYNTRPSSSSTLSLLDTNDKPQSTLHHHQVNVYQMS